MTKDPNTGKRALFAYPTATKIIANKLRNIRLTKGLSQGDVADKLNVSMQQVQKYEKGRNTISAVRLIHLAQICKTPMSYFYDDLLPLEEVGGSRQKYANKNLSELSGVDNFAAKMACKIMTLSESSRVAVNELIKSLARAQTFNQSNIIKIIEQSDNMEGDVKCQK